MSISNTESEREYRYKHVAAAEPLPLGVEGLQWILPLTCPRPGCSCRTTLVLFTEGGREELMSRTALVRDAWHTKGGYMKAFEAAKDVKSFFLNMDSGEMYDANNEEPLNRNASPEVASIAMHIDGEVLDAIARCWCLGKGQPDPDEIARSLSRIEIPDFQAGQKVAWGEAMEESRQDLYVVGDHVYEAVDLYCVEPNCACGDVAISFIPLKPRGAPVPGDVFFSSPDKVVLKPEKERYRERLEQLWSAFLARYPSYGAHFARRSAFMHGLAGKVFPKPVLNLPARAPAPPKSRAKKEQRRRARAARSANRRGK